MMNTAEHLIKGTAKPTRDQFQDKALTRDSYARLIANELADSGMPNSRYVTDAVNLYRQARAELETIRAAYFTKESGAR